MKTTFTLALLASAAFASACNLMPTMPGANSTEVATTEKTATSSMTLPATTKNAAALKEYELGWADFENSRFLSAHNKFSAAAKADPSFAIAHLMAASTANSTESFVTNVSLASANKAGASDGEKLLIETFEHYLANDASGAIETTTKLTALHPMSPAARVFQGNAYGNVNDAVNARAAFAKAIKLDAKYVPGHIGLGNSFLTQEPKDFAMAEEHFKHAVALTPNEPNPHDLLGDVHRAQNNLKAAYDDYTKAAELAPDNGGGLQQRGHVNSFLGNYDAARADYEQAAVLEDARGSGAGPSFRTFGAYVSLHEGNRTAAIEKLQTIADELEGSTVEGAMDSRIAALDNIALIAIEDFKMDIARDAIASSSTISASQAEALDSDDVRRGAKASKAYWEGMAAARAYDAKGAAAKAKAFEGYVASNTNPRKLERMHEILGMSAYRKGEFDSAVEHLSEGNHANNMYIKYYLARANESAGNAAEASRLYGEMAVYNFNEPGYAMFRKDIVARANK